VAAERGVNLAGRLPAAPAIANIPPAPATAQAPSAPRGPTSEQMAAAQGMAPGDQQAMIEGMVSGLAERLKQNPRDRAGWERLLRARMVLGQPQQAAADYRAASKAFAGSRPDQQALREAALQLGVPVG
jgi:cytochrome c-type biogenesis protein CcmH